MNEDSLHNYVLLLATRIERAVDLLPQEKEDKIAGKFKKDIQSLCMDVQAKIKMVRDKNEKE